MELILTAIERAFALDRSVSCETVSEIKRQLVREGFSANQIEGKALNKQLRDLIAIADRTSARSDPNEPLFGKPSSHGNKRTVLIDAVGLVRP